MKNIEHLFTDPRLRADLLERMDDDLLMELVEVVDPVELSAEELGAAWSEVCKRLDPPRRLLEVLGAHGHRLLGSTLASLQSWVAPLEEARDALTSTVFGRPAPAHLGGGAGEGGLSPLALVPREKDAPVLRHRHCRTSLRWEPAGRVVGEIHVSADQIGSMKDWERGWVLVDLEDIACCAFFLNQAEDGLRIEIDEPAPNFDSGAPLPLPPAAMAVTLIQAD